MQSNDIENADAALASAAQHLESYLRRKIAEAGNDYRLAERLGIPRSTIELTLRRRSVLAMRRLAYRIMQAEATRTNRQL
jgi:hypothetical protein